jgi:hypothetical protein
MQVAVGGAYSKSTSIGLTANQTIYTNIGGPSSFGSPNSSSVWFNTSNVPPTDKNTGVLAYCGMSGLQAAGRVDSHGTGGGLGIGDVCFVGGNGAYSGSYGGGGGSGSGGIVVQSSQPGIIILTYTDALPLVAGGMFNMF